MPAKIMTVVGGRPQFVKASTVSREIAARDGLAEYMVHTGQHFDRNMSGLFFEQLGIPEPNINLGVSGGTHAQMTGRMMIALEDVMLQEAPDAVAVYGDMNSTLAGALAAVKLHIPLCHIEAGGRTRHLTNPEEANRVCADHVSTICCAVVEGDMENLAMEGLSERSRLTGDTMYDAFLHQSDNVLGAAGMSLRALNGDTITVPEHYVYLTCHRAENTDKEKLSELLAATEALDVPVVYPVHPRVQPFVTKIADAGGFANTLLVEPVGYLESVSLTCGADKVLTDSGGLQREAFFARKKCVTLMDFPVIPQTMVDGRNELSSMNRDSILEALSHEQYIDEDYRPFGDGSAARKTVDAIEECLEGSL